MKKKAVDATIEELIQDVSYWENPDEILLIAHDGKGNFTVSYQNWNKCAKGRTLKAALLKLGKNNWNTAPGYSSLDWRV